MSCDAGLRKTGVGAPAQGQGSGPQPTPTGSNAPQQRAARAAELSRARKRKSVRFNIPPEGAHAASLCIPCPTYCCALSQHADHMSGTCSVVLTSSCEAALLAQYKRM